MKGEKQYIVAAYNNKYNCEEKKSQRNRIWQIENNTHRKSKNYGKKYEYNSALSY